MPSLKWTSYIEPLVSLAFSFLFTVHRAEIWCPSKLLLIIVLGALLPETHSVFFIFPWPEMFATQGHSCPQGLSDFFVLALLMSLHHLPSPLCCKEAIIKELKTAVFGRSHVRYRNLPICIFIYLYLVIFMGHKILGGPLVDLVVP